MQGRRRAPGLGAHPSAAAWPVIDWGQLPCRPRPEKTRGSCQLFVLLFYNCGQCHMSGSRLGARGHKGEWLFNGVSCQRLKTQ